MRFSRSLTLLGFGADVSSLGSSPMDFPASFLLFLGAPAAFLVFFSAIEFDPWGFSLTHRRATIQIVVVQRASVHNWGGKVSSSYAAYQIKVVQKVSRLGLIWTTFFVKCHRIEWTL